jgi:hypothetical protein
MNVPINESFDSITDNAVKAFQKMAGQKEDGIVDSLMFEVLTNPMRWAFTKIDNSTNLRDLIIAYATEHLKCRAVELSYKRKGHDKKEGNLGPWVRAYLEGNEGEEWSWCMGFAQTVLDLAFSTMGKNYSTLMPVTGRCSDVGKKGLVDGVLIRNKDLSGRINEVNKGDLFLVVKNDKHGNPTSDQWRHTGIVTGVSGNLLQTIEGNSNDEGSANGYEVCNNPRDISRQNIDIFKLNI